MKKFTLILSLMVAMVTTAMAQITPNTSAYTIKSVNRGYLYYDANNAGSVTSSSHGSSIVDATPTGATNEQFAFLRTENTAENQYYLYSIGASQFVTYTGNNGVKLELTDAPACTWTLDASGDYYGIKVPGTSNTYINITNWQAVNGCKVFGTGLDEGNKMTLTEVATALDLSAAIALIEEYEANLVPEVVITDAAELNNNKVYTMVTTRGWLIYNSANPDVVASTASYTTFATGADVAACQWAIYKSATTSKYYLYNIGAGKFVGQNTEESGRFPFVAEVTNDIQVVKSTTGTEYAFVFSTDNYGAINHFNHNAAPGVANWKGNAGSGGLRSLNDAGSAHRLVEVDDIDPSVLEAIATAVAEFENNTKIITYKFMYNGNLVAEQVTEAEKGEAYPAINIQAPYGVTPVAADLEFMSGTVTVDETIEIGLEVTKELPFETAASANAITTWYLVRMHTNQPGYIGDIAEDNTVNVAKDKSSDVANENYIWGFVGDVFSGITVVNKGTGKKLTSTGDGNVTLTDEGTPFFVAETSETTENATNGFCLRKHDSNKYLNANYNASKLSHWGSTDAGSTFFLTEYEEANVTVSNANWATMYLGYAVYVPEGVNVYTISGVENGYVTKVPVEGVIPANTGVLLENAGDFTFKKAAKDAAAIAGNLMNGSVEDSYVEGQAYVLADGNNGVGFYKTILNKDGEGNDGTTHFLNNAGKAYFVLPEAETSAAYYGFDWNGTTGVEKVEIRNENGAIFDLTGRKVNSITAPGIYIVGGKKVLVK